LSASALSIFFLDRETNVVDEDAHVIMAARMSGNAPVVVIATLGDPSAWMANEKRR
jgi:hypothetical protein